jgi:hypothetical protein
MQDSRSVRSRLLRLIASLGMERCDSFSIAQSGGEPNSEGFVAADRRYGAGGWLLLRDIRARL